MNNLTAVYFATTILWGAYCGIISGRDGTPMLRMILTRYLPGALGLGIAYMIVAYGLFR